MRYDLIRRVLMVLVAGLIFLPSALFPQQTSSAVRSVRLSAVNGRVTVQRPGATQVISAQVNTPIEEGSVVSTSFTGLATVELENGSKIELSEFSIAVFTSLGVDARGNKLSEVTLKAGVATYLFIPDWRDAYKVKVGQIAFTPNGRTVFQTAASERKVVVIVSSGSVTVSAHSRSLTLGKGNTMELDAVTAEETEKSHVRIVRLSYASGTVTMKRPASPEWENASVNTPIQQDFKLSTSGHSYAEVEFENGSTARLGEFSRLAFDQLAMGAWGDKLNGITLEQGYATFHLLPEHFDAYHVKVGDATLTANGKSEFRTDIERNFFRVEVFKGSVDVATPTRTVNLAEGRVLERQSGSTEMAFNIHKGIDKDAWDRWTEARDTQEQRASKDQPGPPTGLRYGWSELDTYGEWVRIPGRGFGWSPYARAGWAPYTNGRWEWYPGFGWVWVSNEPWGWLPYHCGQWDFDDFFGWFWTMPMGGCGIWEPSLVDWFVGSGWIGWAPRHGHGQPGVGLPPSGAPGSGHPPGHPWPGHPGPGHPGPGHHDQNSLIAMRAVTTVPLSVVQNRQVISPQMVNRTLVGEDSRIERPPFEPAPHPTLAPTLMAEGGRTLLKTGAATPTHTIGATGPASASGLRAAALAGSRMGGAPHHSSAPPTVLMGGDATKESALLSGHHLHSASEPLRARDGTTLGGHYPVRGTVGEFRAEGFRGGGVSGASRVGGSQGGIAVITPSGGAGAVVVSHGSGGGFSHGSSGGGWSGASSGGAASGGGHSGGGGGGGFGGGGHSGGGGGGGFGGGGHSGGGGGSSGGGHR